MTVEKSNHGPGSDDGAPRGVSRRGFKTVRDIAGNPFAVKKAIDAGKFPGPRMLVAGPPLGQTGGHFT